MFQYTVTAALLASYVARRTNFLSPTNQPIATQRDQQVDEELGQDIIACRPAVLLSSRMTEF